MSFYVYSFMQINSPQITIHFVLLGLKVQKDVITVSNIGVRSKDWIFESHISHIDWCDFKGDNFKRMSWTTEGWGIKNYRIYNLRDCWFTSYVYRSSTIIGYFQPNVNTSKEIFVVYLLHIKDSSKHRNTYALKQYQEQLEKLTWEKMYRHNEIYPVDLINHLKYIVWECKLTLLSLLIFKP